MRYRHAYLTSLGYELAPVVITSGELEARLAPAYDRLHLSAGQLEALTGVQERRWWPARHRLSDGATAAARDALAHCAVRPQDLGALIYTGVCREHREPATACRIADLLGVGSAAVIYDLSNACLGMLNGILEVANRVELGHIKAGLVVSCESAREINDIAIEQMNRLSDMPTFVAGLATLTGGSGAAAIVITDGSFGDSSRRRQLAGGVHENAPEHHDLCRWGTRPLVNSDGSTAPAHREEFMETDSVKVLEHGVQLGQRTWRSLMNDLQWQTEEVDRVICHQVGSAHQDTILRTIGVPVSKDFVTYPFLGNMGTVSLPLTAAIAEERGKLLPGQKVAFLGIGSGLNCLMQGYQW